MGSPDVESDLARTERLRMGDPCEFRHPASRRWQPGIVRHNGGPGHWQVIDWLGASVTGLHIEHVRAPGTNPWGDGTYRPPSGLVCEWRVEFENRSAETTVVPVIAASHGDAVRAARPHLTRKHGATVVWWPVRCYRVTPAEDEAR